MWMRSQAKYGATIFYMLSSQVAALFWDKKQTMFATATARYFCTDCIKAP